MAFLTVGKEHKEQMRLYLMEITLPSGLVVCKFGKSSGTSSKQRMLQICGDVYEAYSVRRTPSIKIIRDRKCDNPFELEKVFREFFMDYQYVTKATWCGSTECYVIPVSDAKATYDLVMESQVPTHTYVLPPPDPTDELSF